MTALLAELASMNAPLALFLKVISTPSTPTSAPNAALAQMPAPLALSVCPDGSCSITSSTNDALAPRAGAFLLAYERSEMQIKFKNAPS